MDGGGSEPFEPIFLQDIAFLDAWLVESIHDIEDCTCGHPRFMQGEVKVFPSPFFGGCVEGVDQTFPVLNAQGVGVKSLV